MQQDVITCVVLLFMAGRCVKASVILRCEIFLDVQLQCDNCDNAWRRRPMLCCCLLLTCLVNVLMKRIINETKNFDEEFFFIFWNKFVIFFVLVFPPGTQAS